MPSLPHLLTECVSENATGCPLYIDLRTCLRFAMSSLELEGWIDQARRACGAGSLTQGELDTLLEMAQCLAGELMEP